MSSAAGTDAGPAATSSTRIASAVDVGDGAWRSVALTWERGGDALVYVDGVQVAAEPHNGEAFAPVAAICLGASVNEDRALRGDLDEVRYLDGVRPADSISLEVRAVRDALFTYEPVEVR